jgi:hypothetical protein
VCLDSCVHTLCLKMVHSTTRGLVKWSRRRHEGPIPRPPSCFLLIFPSSYLHTLAPGSFEACFCPLAWRSDLGPTLPDNPTGAISQGHFLHSVTAETFLCYTPAPGKELNCPMSVLGPLLTPPKALLFPSSCRAQTVTSNNP